MPMDYHLQPDSKLILKVLNNDSGAFIVIFDRYYVLLFSFAVRRTDDRQRAKDIVYEVLNFEAFKRDFVNYSGNILEFLIEKVGISVLANIKNAQPTEKYQAKLSEYLSKLDSNIKSHHPNLNTASELIRREIAALPEEMKLQFLKMQLHAGNTFKY